MSWSTGWISRVAHFPTRARGAPQVSSPTLRSLRTTSGLFNTGIAGDSTSEITSNLATFTTTQPGPSTSSMLTDKFVGCHDDFLDEALQDTDDFNMDMFGDLGGTGGDFDPLGDASLDSFIDLSALLSEDTAFLDPAQVEDPAPMPDFGQNDKSSSTTTSITTSLKRSFDEMEAGSTINFSDLSGCVGLTTTAAAVASPNLDHDYFSKRPRMSETTATEEPASMMKEEEVFLFTTPTPPAPTPTPTPTPTPSTSYSIINPPQEKSCNRREKNNVASKRSRESRKQKFVDMEGEAGRLITENAQMKKRIAQLERLAKQMKEVLVAKMAGK